MIKKFLFILLLIFLIFSKTTQSCNPKQNYCLTFHQNLDLCIECDNSVLSQDEDGDYKEIQTCKISENYCIECDSQSNLCENCEKGLAR